MVPLRTKACRLPRDAREVGLVLGFRSAVRVGDIPDEGHAHGQMHAHGQGRIWRRLRVGCAGRPINRRPAGVFDLRCSWFFRSAAPV